MRTTLKLAGVLVPSVFVIAVLHFVHEAMRPLVLPLLFLAAAATLAWFVGRSRKGRS